MRALTISWQNALAAVATAAFLGLVSAGTRAEEKPRPENPREERKAPAERREGAERKIPTERREGPERPRREGEERRGPEMDARARELIEHRGRLEEKARDLERRLRELPRDRDAEARELRQNLERIGAELREVNAKLSSLRRPEGEPGPRPGALRSPEEIERRVRHVRVAVENLHAAGLHDQAERVAREAKEAMHPGVPAAVRELAAQVQDLRRQVQELREQLHRSRGEDGPRR